MQKKEVVKRWKPGSLALRMLSVYSLVGFLSYFAACSNEVEDPYDEATCGTEERSLSADVMPIIQSNCAISGCHNGHESPTLTSAQNVISHAERIKNEILSGDMPPRSSGKKLSETQVKTIACWVNSGAANN